LESEEACGAISGSLVITDSNNDDVTSTATWIYVDEYQTSMVIFADDSVEAGTYTVTTTISLADYSDVTITETLAIITVENACVNGNEISSFYLESENTAETTYNIG